jgi:hypothetical protein
MAATIDSPQGVVVGLAAATFLELFHTPVTRASV